MMLIFVASLTLGMLFLSCSDENNEDENTNSIESLKSDGLSNDKNPFNYYGELHNSFLNRIGVAIKSELDSLSAEKEVSKTTLKQLFDKAVDYESEFVSDTIGNQYSKDEVKDMSLQLISKLSERKSDSLDERIKTAISKSDDDIDVFISNICEIEDDYVDKWNSGDSTVEYSLMAITVFKYSILYWKDAIDNSNNPYHNYFIAAYIDKSITLVDTKESWLSKAFDAVCNWACDAVDWVVGNAGKLVHGIICGGICDYGLVHVIPEVTSFGATVGSFFGPQGSVIGATAGTVVGIGATAAGSVAGFIGGFNE